MKLFKRFLLLMMCAIPTFAQGQVATTAGSNLTAWNGNTGATNNNNWNQAMNSRTLAGGAGSGATADFGNCNSLILRCAQPKCAGCNTMDVARPIVAGCVNSNATCKKYGDDLIEFISAQMVSNAASKAQQAEIAAQTAAAQAAAAQNNAQLEQMQMQMMQMQQQMQEQNAQQMQQMQAALDEQKALAAAAMEQVNKETESKVVASGTTSGIEVSADVVNAAERGVDADILVRQQISGQILTKIENAQNALKTLRVTMDSAFKYAGCDTRGNNCSGPKRVKVFKEKAHAFFEPYDVIVDEAYEALEMALAVGADVSDVIMMLNGACNQWGKFLCVGENASHEPSYYKSHTCVNGRSVKGDYVKGGQECTVDMAVPPQDDARCTLTQLIGGVDDREPVLREWLDENYEGDQLVRVGCATSALESIAIFGRRSSKKGATLDLDTLERIILQDAPEYVGVNRYSGGGGDSETERLKYCALTPTGYQSLLTAVQTKKLPKKICAANQDLTRTWEFGGPVAAGAIESVTSRDIISGADTKERCERWKTLVPEGCKLDWVDSDGSGNAVEGRCKLISGNCVFVGNDILSQPEYTERIASQAIAASNNSNGNDALREGLDKCNKANGRYASDGKCYCGKVPMDVRIQNCGAGDKVVGK